MKTLVGILTVVALQLAARDAAAQCAFAHPTKATKMTLGLVQAFVCATCACPHGHTNNTTEGGIPSCAPPETYHQYAGAQLGGWLWDQRNSKGVIQFTATKNKVVDPQNDPLNSADLMMSVKISGILAEGVGPANGEGTLAAVARFTLADRVGGDMTVVDFPLGIPVAVNHGGAKMRTSMNAHLNALPQPGLPGCTAIEIPFVGIIDPNGDQFASTGVFLP